MSERKLKSIKKIWNIISYSTTILLIVGSIVYGISSYMNRDVIYRPTKSDLETLVYFVEDGKKYHNTNKCRTLERSSTVYMSKLKDSKRFSRCKVCY